MISLATQAYATVSGQAIGSVVNPIITNIVMPIVEVMFGVAVIVFVFGVLQMVMNPTSEDARKRGKMSILGGLVGLLIMLSAWGIIYIISNTEKGISSGSSSSASSQSLF